MIRKLIINKISYCFFRINKDNLPAGCFAREALTDPVAQGAAGIRKTDVFTVCRSCDGECRKVIKYTDDGTPTELQITPPDNCRGLKRRGTHIRRLSKRDMDD